MRAYHHLRILSRRHQITLVSLTREPIQPKALEEIRGYCKEVIVVPHGWFRRGTTLISAPFRHYPLQTLLRRSRSMQKMLARELKHGNYDLAHVQMIRMAPYLEKVTHLPRVVDLIDALSVNMRRRYETDHGLLKPLLYLEWKRSRDYEREVCSHYDQATIVSQEDRAEIGDFSNLNVNANGVDLERFRPAGRVREPNLLVFVGTMNYFPNIRAAVYFAEKILPLIRQKRPGVRLRIVGQNPTSRVRQLEQDPAVTVTGFVSDVVAELNSASLAVCPMLSGSGMQFKVIEAMATATPVVATPFALGGLGVTEGKHLVVARTSEQFAQEVVSLLEDKKRRETLTSHGLEFVRERYSWDELVRQLEDVYEKAINSKAASGLTAGVF